MGYIHRRNKIAEGAELTTPSNAQSPSQVGEIERERKENDYGK